MWMGTRMWMSLAAFFFFFFLTLPKKPYSGNATMWGPTAKVEGVY